MENHLQLLPLMNKYSLDKNSIWESDYIDVIHKIIEVNRESKMNQLFENVTEAIDHGIELFVSRVDALSGFFENSITIMTSKNKVKYTKNKPKIYSKNEIFLQIQEKDCFNSFNSKNLLKKLFQTNKTSINKKNGFIFYHAAICPKFYISSLEIETKNFPINNLKIGFRSVSITYLNQIHLPNEDSFALRLLIHIKCLIIHFTKLNKNYTQTQELNSKKHCSPQAGIK
jgi:hypothetical protein